MLVRSRLERGREDSQKNLQSSGNTPPLGLNVESAALQFQTRIQDTDQGTASERFRNRLQATPFFNENSEIVSEMAVGGYLRRFSIQLDLTKPLNVE